MEFRDEPGLTVLSPGDTISDSATTFLNFPLLNMHTSTCWMAHTCGEKKEKLYEFMSDTEFAALTKCHWIYTLVVILIYFCYYFASQVRWDRWLFGDLKGDFVFKHMME